jgi:hypothetical protein
MRRLWLTVALLAACSIAHAQSLNNSPALNNYIAPTAPTSDSSDRIANTSWAGNASNITSGTLPAARLPNPTASTLGGIESFASVAHQWINAISTSGVPSATQPACGDLSNAAASCSTDATNASNITSGTLSPSVLNGLSVITNSLGGDVALNNSSNYFDGPSVAQGSTGTWFASGTVTLSDSASGAFFCKLWDGTTVIASAASNNFVATDTISMALSGRIATPAGNIRISCRDPSTTTGSIKFNTSGNSKDSTVTAFRIN